MNLISKIIISALLSFISLNAFGIEPQKLSQTPFPIITVKNVSMPDVQDTIIGVMLRAGVSPVKQESNILVFENELSGMQAFAVQMLQGNSGWQNPKGRQTFTMARQGNDVIVTTKYETVATNMLNASNSITVNSNAMFNEHYLGLQLIAGLAEKRIQIGDHLMLGITAYELPKRKLRSIGVSVVDVVSGGPAQKAGIAKGDIVTSISGIPTPGQTMSALGLMGYLQEEKAVLNIQGKGDITVIKNPAPEVSN